MDRALALAVGSLAIDGAKPLSPLQTPLGTSKKRKAPSTEAQTRQSEVGSWKSQTWDQGLIPKRKPIADDITRLQDLVNSEMTKSEMFREVVDICREETEFEEEEFQEMLKERVEVVRKDLHAKYQVKIDEKFKTEIESRVEARKKQLEEHVNEWKKQRQAEFEEATAESTEALERARAREKDAREWNARALDSVQTSMSVRRIFEDSQVKLELKCEEHIKAEELIISLQQENANLKKFKTKVQRKTKGVCFECPHCDGDITSLLR
jgi:hypothetical protein